MLAARLGYVAEPGCGVLIVRIDDLRRQLAALRASIERHNGR
jgi:hypothetical protein